MTTTLWVQMYFFIALLLYLVGYIYYTWINPYRRGDRDEAFIQTFLWCLFWLPAVIVISVCFSLWYAFTKTGLDKILTKERKWLRF